MARHLTCEERGFLSRATEWRRRGGRPDVIKPRHRYGDREGDTIVGKGCRSALLTLVERKSGERQFQNLCKHGWPGLEPCETPANARPGLPFGPAPAPPVRF